MVRNRLYYIIKKYRERTLSGFINSSAYHNISNANSFPLSIFLPWHFGFVLSQPPLLATRWLPQLQASHTHKDIQKQNKELLLLHVFLLICGRKKVYLNSHVSLVKLCHMSRPNQSLPANIDLDQSSANWSPKVIPPPVFIFLVS